MLFKITYTYEVPDNVEWYREQFDYNGWETVREALSELEMAEIEDFFPLVGFNTTLERS